MQHICHAYAIDTCTALRQLHPMGCIVTLHSVVTPHYSKCIIASNHTKSVNTIRTLYMQSGKAKDVKDKKGGHQGNTGGRRKLLNADGSLGIELPEFPRIKQLVNLMKNMEVGAETEEDGRRRLQQVRSCSKYTLYQCSKLNPSCFAGCKPVLDRNARCGAMQLYTCLQCKQDCTTDHGR